MNFGIIILKVTVDLRNLHCIYTSPKDITQ